VLRLRGGGKKRKKKVYSTPKKIKHKRKKTKLAVLKYYRVDGDGKIERLRRECPTETVSFFYSEVEWMGLTMTVWCWHLHGCDEEPLILWEVPSHVHLRQEMSAWMSLRIDGSS
jgi:ubiquitin